jgi:predicted ATPase
MLGYPDQAVERSEQAITVARATAHSASITEAMIWRAQIAMLRREIQDARERAAAALVLATEYGLPLFTGYAIIVDGWALSEQGHSAEGIAQIREGLSGLEMTGEELYRPCYLATLADALYQTGQVEEGLSALEEAIESSRRSRVAYWDAELQRRKGELLLAANGTHRTAAEACFRQAIAIAQAQLAKSLELRAATSLARLFAKEGQREQAHDLLAPIYDWFTEGFETADLQEAKALLDELCE